MHCKQPRSKHSEPARATAHLWCCGNATDRAGGTVQPDNVISHYPLRWTYGGNSADGKLTMPEIFRAIIAVTWSNEAKQEHQAMASRTTPLPMGRMRPGAAGEKAQPSTATRKPQRRRSIHTVWLRQNWEAGYQMTWKRGDSPQQNLHFGPGRDCGNLYGIG